MDTKIVLKLFTLSFLLCCLKCINAYPSYQKHIPNGDKIYDPCYQDGSIWSGVGHQLVSGGGALNPFGIDLHQHMNKNGMLWTKSLCEIDSDGDGLSNGEELGDPQCKWTRKLNAVLSNESISHPGICEPFDSGKCKKKNKWFNCNTKEFKCTATEAPDVKMLNLRMPETPVQQNGMKYMCTHFNVPFDETYQIIAWKPHIDNKRVVHHISWYGCDETENPPKPNDPQKCINIDGPDNCQQLTVWVAGIDGVCFPDQLGFKLGRHGFKRFMLQVHWNNGDNTPDYTDSSGLVLYYTPRLRQYDAAILTTGDVGISLEPGRKEVGAEGICSEHCTQRMLKGPVYIYSVYSHMHDLGHKQKVEHYRNGTLMQVLADELDFHAQKVKLVTFSTPVEFLPGDEIRTKCVYDTTSKNTTTRFGWGIDKEMCFGMITIYPAENVVSKHHCYSWFKIPHCVLEGSFNALQKTSNIIKMGMRTLMRFRSKIG